MVIYHGEKKQNPRILIHVAVCPRLNEGMHSEQVCLLKKGKRFDDSFLPLYVHIPQNPSYPVIGILRLNVLNTSVIPRTAYFSGGQVKVVIGVNLMQGLIQDSAGEPSSVGDTEVVLSS